MKEVNLMKYGFLWEKAVGYLLRDNKVIGLEKRDEGRVKNMARFGPVKRGEQEILL